MNALLSNITGLAKVIGFRLRMLTCMLTFLHLRPKAGQKAFKKKIKKKKLSKFAENDIELFANSYLFEYIFCLNYSRNLRKSVSFMELQSGSR